MNFLKFDTKSPISTILQSNKVRLPKRAQKRIIKAKIVPKRVKTRKTVLKKYC